VRLTYQIDVEGPGSFVPLTWHADGSLSTSALLNTTPFVAQTSIAAEILGPGTVLSDSATCTVGTTACTKSTSGFTAFYDTGINYTVTLTVLLQGELLGPVTPDSLALLATLHSLFSIPSDFQNASQYTILYSPGLNSEIATPLPATLPLFATGLGALGLFGWRRKRKQAA
jgi:hypothetical protein